MADTEQGANNSMFTNVIFSESREDNEEMLLEIFEQGGFDINFQDGLGNTALHYAASHGSMDVLEHILSHDECDVDPVNRLEGATPLHLAVRLEDEETKKLVVSSLLDAGADTNIKDKNGDTPFDLAEDDKVIAALIRKARAQASVSMDDVASDDDGEPGSGSGSGSDED
ncbi:hypothetical protein EIP86_002039 [Pleurotus ostreatoroseus]|nr:hypothetical protein EIP86_002039 [Pleurotus ostreatoroseus]